MWGRLDCVGCVVMSCHSYQLLELGIALQVGNHCQAELMRKQCSRMCMIDASIFTDAIRFLSYLRLCAFHCAGITASLRNYLWQHVLNSRVDEPDAGGQPKPAFHEEPKKLGSAVYPMRSTTTIPSNGDVKMCEQVPGSSASGCEYGGFR